MKDMQDLFANLAKSKFRRRFSLKGKEKKYLEENGMETILHHGREFIRSRLAPAYIPNDGKQTPMKNHPVFIAQHATATCCRNCLQKWHDIPQGRELSDSEINYIMSVIEIWLVNQMRSQK
jgi:hypothetical protein